MPATLQNIIYHCSQNNVTVAAHQLQEHQTSAYSSSVISLPRKLIVFFFWKHYNKLTFVPCDKKGKIVNRTASFAVTITPTATRGREMKRETQKWVVISCFQSRPTWLFFWWGCTSCSLSSSGERGLILNTAVSSWLKYRKLFIVFLQSY